MFKQPKKPNRYSVSIVKRPIREGGTYFKVYHYGKHIARLELNGTIWDINGIELLELPLIERQKIRRAAAHSLHTKELILGWWANQELI